MSRIPVVTNKTVEDDEYDDSEFEDKNNRYGKKYNEDDY